MRRLIIITMAMVVGAAGLAGAWSWSITGGGGGTTKSINFVAKGSWSTLAVYSSTINKVHFVTFSGSTWAAGVTNTGQRPSPNSTYWGKLTGGPGATGATGPQGIQGVKGDTGAQGPAGSGTSGSQPFKNLSSALTGTPSSSSVANSDTFLARISGIWSQITWANFKTALSSWFTTTFLDTDGTMAGNSDSKVPSQKAVKTYVAANGGGLSDAPSDGSSYVRYNASWFKFANTTTMNIAIMTATAGGAVPTPPNDGTTKYLREDATWAVPPGGGGTTTNAVTFNNSGSGASSGSTFDGSAARTISYNSVGAQPILGNYSCAGGTYMKKYVSSSNNWYCATPSTSAGSVAWGAITGTISAQSDLNTALGLKAPAASPTFTGTITTPLTQYSIPYIGASGALSQDANNFYYNSAGGPGSTPTFQFGPRASDAMDATVELYTATSGTHSLHVHNTGAQGSTGGAIVSLNAVPSGAAMTSGNRLGSLQFGGSQDTSQTLGSGAAINAFTTQAWTSAHLGSQLIFNTVPNNSTTRTQALLLDQDQSATFASTVTATSFNLITALASSTSPMDGSAAVGTSTAVARQDHVHPVDTSRAAVAQTMYIGTTSHAINRASASEALTGITSIDGTAANLSGTPTLPNGTTATTQSAGSNDTKLATDAYVDAAVGVNSTFPTVTNTALASTTINLDGVSYADYNYSNGTTAASYTTGFTSRPSSGRVRYITLTLNPSKASGVITMTWTGVTWIGTAGAGTTTASKASTYSCMVGNSTTYCAIVAEAY